MKKIISLSLVVVSMLAMVLVSKPKTVLANYEIGFGTAVLSVQSPRVGFGYDARKGDIKIQSFKLDAVRGGFVRIKTRQGAEDCFELRVYKVPNGVSLQEAMPFVNNLECIADLNGNKNQELKGLPAGTYIYVLVSKVPYFYEWETEKHLAALESVQIVISAKLSGSRN